MPQSKPVEESGLWPFRVYVGGLFGDVVCVVSATSAEDAKARMVRTFADGITKVEPAK